MTHWVSLDDWDSDGINKQVQCDCDLSHDHHALDGPMPSPIKPWTPLSDEDKRKVDEWIAKFAKTLPVTDKAFHLKPVDWQAEIAGWGRMIADMPPRRTEPIKLTPGQWAVLPHGDPRAAPPYARPLGDLMGIPVVMVDSEKDSTPVVEGWFKRKPWWRRLLQALRRKP